jgi:hypothetical protein
LHNVGIANLRAGKLVDAMDAIEEAIRIRKASLGQDDTSVTVSFTIVNVLRIIIPSSNLSVSMRGAINSHA